MSIPRTMWQIYVVVHRRHVQMRYTSRMSTEKGLFRDRVLAVVRTIPTGTVCTYGEVAARAGNAQAARAVGAVLRTNYDPAIPCHRVVRSDGSLGGYNRGVEAKKRILEKERKGRTI